MKTKPAEPILSVCNAGVFFRRKTGLFGGEAFWALKDISLDLYQGETLGIIGRNGAGKSTLLQLMAGIIKTDKGSLVRKKGYRASLLALQLGFIHYLTGRENIILSGLLMGLRKKQVEAAMDEIIAFSELGDFIDQPIITYSSGMIARLGFSVAFYADPDIILVDEVLGVGDAEFSIKSTRMMQEKIHGNKTVVFVSHNAAMVKQLCNRVVWIEHGTTCREGEPTEVLSEYERQIAAEVNGATAGNQLCS
ncbi:MAG: ABC transporter ATP-binding protein [Gammaproteobacteria bacterium]|nr:ABC transporter ATP-binding protein [Gammaproteobacteria bacterium]